MTEQKNKDIRELIEQAGIRHFDVADELHISACTLSVWLRHELPQDRKERIKKAIRSLTTTELKKNEKTEVQA